MSERLLKHLRDALDAAEAIESFLRGVDFDGYRQNRLLRSAVERQLTILGEAARRALDEMPDLRAAMPDLAFAVSLRNRLVHGYDAVDDVIVFDTVGSDVPNLADQLRRRLEAAGSG